MRIEIEARGFELRHLYTEATITARPVFEAMGFRTIMPQSSTVRGEALLNYGMEKRLELQLELTA